MSQDAETVARQICDGCGHSMTDAEIIVGGFIACCPERKMRDMTFLERSLSARLAAAEAREAGLRALLAQAEGALRIADQFITNGVDLGFIHMPEMEADTANATPGLIRKALAAIRAAKEKTDAKA